MYTGVPALLGVWPRSIFFYVLIFLTVKKAGVQRYVRIVGKRGDRERGDRPTHGLFSFLAFFWTIDKQSRCGVLYFLRIASMWNTCQ